MIGHHLSTSAVAELYRLLSVPYVDTTFLGVPQIPSLLHVVFKTTRAAITSMLNADILLFERFPFAMHKLHDRLTDTMLAVAARRDFDNLPI